MASSPPARPEGPEGPEGPLARLEAALRARLDAFVAAAGGGLQRSPGWYAEMGTHVGGSEVAALLGHSPYATFFSVAAAKLALRRAAAPPWAGGLACWWGSLFEDVARGAVAADLGAAVVGTDICLKRFPGHRNSPDGYAVVRLYPGGDGALRLWRTCLPAGAATAAQTALLEFKCPLSRAPAGAVPRMYRPQLWSGLAVSPVADFGLFVDARFRKCRLGALGPGLEVDAAFHRRPPGLPPVAWGFMAFFAPRGGPGGDDAARLRRAAGAPAGALVDLGDADEACFAEALRLADAKAFAVARPPACFADGRGADLRTPAAVGAALAGAAGAPPAGFEPWGVLPWKLFDLVYAPVGRHADFAGAVLSRVAELHALVDAALAAPDPDAFLAARAAEAAGGADPGAAPGADPGADPGAEPEDAAARAAREEADLADLADLAEALWAEKSPGPSPA